MQNIILPGLSEHLTIKINSLLGYKKREQVLLKTFCFVRSNKPTGKFNYLRTLETAKQDYGCLQQAVSLLLNHLPIKHKKDCRINITSSSLITDLNYLTKPFLFQMLYVVIASLRCSTKSWKSEVKLQQQRQCT